MHEIQRLGKKLLKKINKFDFIKKKFLNFSLKDTVKRMKRQATDWEETFANHVSNKGLEVSRIYEELLKFSNMKTTHF